MCDFTYQINLYSHLQHIILKLEHWQVEVESTESKVTRLKSEAIFLVFFNLETEIDWWKKENVRGDKMNQKSASKLFSKIGNPWSMVEKW